MRVIAMYLPQFHRIPENDKWWGEGFTDWTSTVNATPLFKGHYQPHIPLDDNYYDLLDKKTMEWQAALMNQYGVDGVCFYHYWFEKGKKVLEKPAENLLMWKDIDMPFCFSWANETWARSWANIKGANVWSNRNENTNDGNGILLRQEYGNEEDWKQHFDYLLPFFLDDRYIKVDNKPVFLIYKTNQIHCLDNMLECWKKLAHENGLDGIYVIGGNSDASNKGVIDASYYHEPVRANRKVLQGYYGKGAKRILYSDVWNEILKESTNEEKTYFCGFVSYDDTPRRGDEGLVIENSTPELFGGYLAELMAKNEANGNDISFINAWNEWGEGMYLEPDTQYGYEYLQEILNAKKRYKNLIPYYESNIHKEIEDRNDKHELYLNDMDLWMDLRESGISIMKWLFDNDYRSVAIYGYGIMGKHLAYEFQEKDSVKLEYIIDKQKDKLHLAIPVYYPDEAIPQVDAIIVASYYFYNSVKKELGTNNKLLSLGSILHKMAEEYLEH